MINRYKNISFFEGLNSLRFIAAFLVVMQHAETIRNKNGLFNLEWLGLFRNGSNAVTFFFVLSGFLITYLLLKENDKTRTISIRNFYIKRMLRIWPLYFLLVIIGTLVLPFMFHILNINYEMPYSLGQVWYYFVFFLPGLVTFFFGHHFLEPLWSIGVEEVFYLVWAPLFKFFKESILWVLLSIIALKILLMSFAEFTPKDQLFYYLVNMFQFEAMAIGGLGAYFIFKRERSLSGLRIYSRWIQVPIYASLIVYLVCSPNIDQPVWNLMFKTPVASRLLIDFLFLYLIIGVSLIDTNLFKLKNKALSFLGEISYGIYMYHMLILFAIIQFLKNYFVNMEPLSGTLLFYAVLTVSVVLVSALSKVLFEDFFLRRKARLDVPAGKR